MAHNPLRPFSINVFLPSVTALSRAQEVATDRALFYFFFT